jgi:hypothetical protein
LFPLKDSDEPPVVPSITIVKIGYRNYIFHDAKITLGGKFHSVSSLSFAFFAFSVAFHASTSAVISRHTAMVTLGGAAHKLRNSLLGDASVHRLHYAALLGNCEFFGFGRRAAGSPQCWFGAEEVRPRDLDNGVLAPAGREIEQR